MLMLKVGCINSLAFLLFPPLHINLTASAITFSVYKIGIEQSIVQEPVLKSWYRYRTFLNDTQPYTQILPFSVSNHPMTVITQIRSKLSFLLLFLRSDDPKGKLWVDFESII